MDHIRDGIADYESVTTSSMTLIASSLIVHTDKGAAKTITINNNGENDVYIGYGVETLRIGDGFCIKPNGVYVYDYPLIPHINILAIAASGTNSVSYQIGY